MTRRIALFGFESTGKTTLAEKLAAYYDAPWSGEYVREFHEHRRGHITAADLPMIARGQIAAEEDAARRARDLVFCDTDLLTHRLWVDLLFPGRCPPWVHGAAWQRACRFALYLYCDIDIAWHNDPQRSFPEPETRRRLATRWRRALDDLPVPVVTLRGSVNQRLAHARHAIDALPNIT